MARKDKKFLSSFAAGSVSGATSTLLFQPLDLVKTRLQVEKPRRVPISSGNPVRNHGIGLLNETLSIVQKEGILALWKGLSASLTRTVPGVGLYFGTLHAMQYTVLGPDTPPSPLAAAAFAGTARTFSCTALLPMTVAKTRMESGKYSYRSVLHALKSIHLQEGLHGLYSGMPATLVRDVSSSSLYYMFYTASKAHVQSLGLDQDRIKYVNFLCAIESALFSCLLTHPADVVKTEQQVKFGYHPGPVNTARRLWKERGVKTFFRGAQARILRRSCGTAFSWTVFENIVDLVGKVV